MKLLRGIAVGTTALMLSAQAAAATLEVFKTPWCGCCAAWIEHVRQAGFTVKVTEVQDIAAVSKKHGVPDKLRSCHSSKAGKYAVEGHVPAADIKRMLKEKPDAIGIAVAGMPAGSPGMDHHSSEKRPYQTVLFTSKGQRVFASH